MARSPKPDTRTPTSLDFLTSVELPLLPLKAGCRLCALFREDPEAYNLAHSHLLFGTPATEVSKLLATRGHDMPERTIYNHVKRHVGPALQQILEMRRQQFALQVAAQDVDPEELEAALTHSLLAQVCAALQRIDLPKLAGSVVEPGDAIEFLDKATKLMKAVAESRRAQTSSDLSKEMVELRRLELLTKRGQFERAARRLLEANLPNVPERVKQQVTRLLMPYVTNVAGQLKALALPSSAEGAAPSPASRTAGRSETRSAKPETRKRVR